MSSRVTDCCYRADGAIAALEFQDASLALTCHFEPGTSCFKEGCLAPFALNGEYDEGSDSLRISFEEASNFSEQPEKTGDERILVSRGVLERMQGVLIQNAKSSVAGFQQQ